MKIFGTHDDATIKQLQTCMDAVPESLGVLCADGHKGYSMPIGGVIAYPDQLSPSGVGYDIACGNFAVRTAVRVSDFGRDELRKIAQEISKQVSFGVGRKNSKPIDHLVLEEIGKSPTTFVKNMQRKAADQLGTVGSGNHYVDLLADSEGFVWVAVHFGSRGFGHGVATGFMNLAQGKTPDARVTGEMDSPPLLIPSNSELGLEYWNAMTLAGQYAYAGRETVVNTVTGILGNPERTFEVHNHHNFTWWEEHFGKNYFVVRKGATPAQPGQWGFIGGSMGDISVIVRGKNASPEGEAALYSTVHGAGRVMSRTQAAGKKKKEKSSWGCGNYRNCDFTAPAKDFELNKPNVCPKCGHKLVWKKGNWQARTGGCVDFAKVQKEVADHGTILIGAGADEAPEVYRPLSQVLAAHSDTIEIVHTLTPIVVVMAGADEIDPYKD